MAKRLETSKKKKKANKGDILHCIEYEAGLEDNTRQTLTGAL